MACWAPVLGSTPMDPRYDLLMHSSHTSTLLVQQEGKMWADGICAPGLHQLMAPLCEPRQVFGVPQGSLSFVLGPRHVLPLCEPHQVRAPSPSPCSSNWILQSSGQEWFCNGIQDKIW